MWKLHFFRVGVSETLAHLENRIWWESFISVFCKPFLLFKAGLYFCGRRLLRKLIYALQGFCTHSLGAGKICVRQMRPDLIIKETLHVDINIWKVSQFIPKWTHNNPNLMHPARVCLAQELYNVLLLGYRSSDITYSRLRIFPPEFNQTGIQCRRSRPVEGHWCPGLCP